MSHTVPPPLTGILLLLLSSLLLREAKGLFFREQWVETSKLTDREAEVDDSFGRAVAIDNGIAVVGAHLDGAGSATIFELVDGEWSAQAKLAPVDTGRDDFYGCSVAISGETVAVGASRDSDGASNSGSVYIYRKEAGSGSWTEEAKLLATGSLDGDYFGGSLAMLANTLIVGATSTFTTRLGFVYVYTFSAGTWSEQARLTSADGTSFDDFGYAVAIGERALVVGARYDDALDLDSGSVYLFHLTDGVWTEQAKLTPSDGAIVDYFGRSVAIDGDIVCVGSTSNLDGPNVGAVYLFHWHEDSWTEHAKLVPRDLAPNVLFGYSLALRQRVLLVGAIGDADLAGAVYSFTSMKEAWTQEAKFVASDGVSGDLFGWDVDFYDGVAIVGTIGDDSYKGSAYTFEWRPFGPIRRVLCALFQFLC